MPIGNDFGRIRQEEKTMQATIQNEFLTLTADTLGAEMVSVKNKQGEEMLWCGDPQAWAGHAPILFPWAGNYADGFTYQGKQYPGCRHGFARKMEYTLLQAEGDSMTFELTSSEETKTKYPFDFVLTVTYQLVGQKVQLRVTVTNKSGEKMPFGLGFHPGFAIPFDANHTTEDYEFRFDKVENPILIDTAPRGLASGKCSILGTGMENIPLTDKLFANDSLCLTGLNSSTLGIYEKDTGRHISCDIAGFPYTLLWSAPTETVRFVCIEPWCTLPGAEGGGMELSEHPAAAVLEPGASDTTILNINFAR